jgi:hypothetical protein
MSFYEFSRMPIFYALLACWISFICRKTGSVGDGPWQISLFSMFICFVYPGVNAWLGESGYHLFDNFVLYCLMSSGIAIAANLTLYFFYYRKYKKAV